MAGKAGVKDKAKGSQSDAKGLSKKPMAARGATASANGGTGVSGNGYNPLLGTFHAVEATAIDGAAGNPQNGGFHLFDPGASAAAEKEAVSSDSEGESEDLGGPEGKAGSTQGAPLGTASKKNGKVDGKRDKDKVRLRNERKHQRQKERRAQELKEKCIAFLTMRKVEALALQLVAMGFSKDRSVVAVTCNGGDLERCVSWLLEGGAEGQSSNMPEVGKTLTKIDISDELARLVDAEMRFGLSRGEIERVVVACEGDLDQMIGTLAAQHQRSPMGASPATSSATGLGSPRSVGGPEATRSSQNGGGSSPSQAGSYLPQHTDQAATMHRQALEQEHQHHQPIQQPTPTFPHQRQLQHPPHQQAAPRPIPGVSRAGHGWGAQAGGPLSPGTIRPWPGTPEGGPRSPIQTHMSPKAPLPGALPAGQPTVSGRPAWNEVVPSAGQPGAIAGRPPWNDQGLGVRPGVPVVQQKGLGGPGPLVGQGFPQRSIPPLQQPGALSSSPQLASMHPLLSQQHQQLQPSQPLPLQQQQLPPPLPPPPLQQQAPLPQHQPQLLQQQQFPSQPPQQQQVPLPPQQQQLGPPGLRQQLEQQKLQQQLQMQRMQRLVSGPPGQAYATLQPSASPQLPQGLPLPLQQMPIYPQLPSSIALQLPAHRVPGSLLQPQGQIPLPHHASGPQVPRPLQQVWRQPGVSGSVSPVFGSPSKAAGTAGLVPRGSTPLNPAAANFRPSAAFHPTQTNTPGSGPPPAAAQSAGPRRAPSGTPFQGPPATKSPSPSLALGVSMGLTMQPSGSNPSPAPTSMGAPSAGGIASSLAAGLSGLPLPGGATSSSSSSAAYTGPGTSTAVASYPGLTAGWGVDWSMDGGADSAGKSKGANWSVPSASGSVGKVDWSLTSFSTSASTFTSLRSPTGADAGIRASGFAGLGPSIWSSTGTGGTGDAFAKGTGGGAGSGSSLGLWGTGWNPAGGVGTSSAMGVDLDLRSGSGRDWSSPFVGQGLFLRNEAGAGGSGSLGVAEAGQPGLRDARGGRVPDEQTAKSLLNNLALH